MCRAPRSCCRTELVAARCASLAERVFPCARRWQATAFYEPLERKRLGGVAKFARPRRRLTTIHFVAVSLASALSRKVARKLAAAYRAFHRVAIEGAFPRDLHRVSVARLTFFGPSDRAAGYSRARGDVAALRLVHHFVVVPVRRDHQRRRAQAAVPAAPAAGIVAASVSAAIAATTAVAATASRSTAALHVNGPGSRKIRRRLRRRVSQRRNQQQRRRERP